MTREDQTAVNELKPLAPANSPDFHPGSDFVRSDELPTPAPSGAVPLELDSPAPLPSPTPSAVPTLAEPDELAALDSAALNEEPKAPAKPEKRKKERIEADEEVRTIDEIETIDQDSQAIWGQFGLVRALNYDGAFVYYPAAGFRYGITLGRMLFVSRAKAQDTLTLELSAMAFRITGYLSDDTIDSYTVASGVASLRYTILTSDLMGIFAYAGYNPRRVIANSGDVRDQATGNLQQPQAAAGLGVIFRLGPGWEARIEGGVDTLIAMGIGLRF